MWKFNVANILLTNHLGTRIYYYGTKLRHGKSYFATYGFETGVFQIENG